jgi:hypothetical protein
MERAALRNSFDRQQPRIYCFKRRLYFHRCAVSKMERRVFIGRRLGEPDLQRVHCGVGAVAIFKVLECFEHWCLHEEREIKPRGFLEEMNS